MLPNPHCPPKKNLQKPNFKNKEAQISPMEAIMLENLETLFDSAPQILQDSTKENALKKAGIFAQNLLEWNTTHNLSGAKNIAQVESNIIDSLLPLSFVPHFSRCLDVGSGAGFPAVAMALCRPSVDFYLCEPRTKRVAFLSFIAQKLELKNLHIQKSRIESLIDSSISSNNKSSVQDSTSHKNLKSSTQDFSAYFPIITSRATMDTQSLINATQNLLSPNGSWLFFKGSKSSDFSHNLYNVKHISAKDLDFALPKGYNSERIYLHISQKY